MKTKPSPPSSRPRFHIPSRLALVTLALGAAVTFAHLPAARAAEDPQPSAQAPANNNSYRLFYDKLADDGDWFQTDEYGYVFQPRAAAQDKTWRPYTDGYWAQTDAGWTWVSNEDFGWACYHYGRWANLVDTGWVWIPGPDWAPAYVSWRVSKDHKQVGWAPLPPEARVTKGAAVEGWVDSAYDVGPDAYTFIDTDQFGDDSYRTHLLPAEQNVTLFSETENVTRIDYRTVGSQSVVYDGGPDVTIIRESSGRPVRELRLETRAENAEFFERGDRRSFAEIRGNQFVVATAAPDVITSTSIRVSQPARINRRLNNFTVDRGYRGIHDPQQADRIRASIRAQSPRPPEQVEREASAALRRNAPADLSGRNAARSEREAATAPNGRSGQPDRQQPTAGTPRQEPQPAATAAAPEGRQTPTREQTRPENREQPRQEASPTAAPRRTEAESPTPRSATPPEKGEGDRPHGRATPGATPAARASATPETDREARAGKRPEGSPTPKEKTEREDQTERNASSKPESSTPAASRRATERNEEKPAEPEAKRNRPEGQEPPSREQKPRNDEADEKKPAPDKTESPSAARRNPEESREKPAENSGRERSEKREAPTAPAAEKEKTSPKP